LENKQKGKPVYLFITGQPIEQQSSQGQILFDGVWVVNGGGYLIREGGKINGKLYNRPVILPVSSKLCDT